jgi:hypothetical protein
MNPRPKAVVAFPALRLAHRSATDYASNEFSRRIPTPSVAVFEREAKGSKSAVFRVTSVRFSVAAIPAICPSAKAVGRPCR